MIFRQSHCVAKLSFRISPRWPAKMSDFHGFAVCFHFEHGRGKASRAPTSSRTNERTVGGVQGTIRVVSKKCHLDFVAQGPLATWSQCKSTVGVSFLLLFAPSSTCGCKNSSFFDFNGGKVLGVSGFAGGEGLCKINISETKWPKMTSRE